MNRLGGHRRDGGATLQDCCRLTGPLNGTISSESAIAVGRWYIYDDAPVSVSFISIIMTDEMPKLSGIKQLFILYADRLWLVRANDRPNPQRRFVFGRRLASSRLCPTDRREPYWHR